MSKKAIIFLAATEYIILFIFAFWIMAPLTAILAIPGIITLIAIKKDKKRKAG